MSVTVEVLKQANTVISGTISPAINSASTFSGVINQCGPPNIQITAINTIIRADIMNAPQSTTTTSTAVMNITGSDLATGDSFFGKLTQQL